MQKSRWMSRLNPPLLDSASSSPVKAGCSAQLKEAGLAKPL